MMLRTLAALALASAAGAAVLPRRAAPWRAASPRPTANAPTPAALLPAAIPGAVPTAFAETAAIEAVRAPSGLAAVTRVVENALAGKPARELADPRADKAAASRELFDLGPAAPAGDAVAVDGPRLGAWEAVDDWLRERLDPGLPSGRAAAWAMDAAWRLRQEPGLGFEEVLARSWAAAHLLGGADVARARELLEDPDALLAGRGLTVDLPGKFEALVARPEGLYAAGAEGLFLKRAGKEDWTKVSDKQLSFYPTSRPRPDEPLLMTESGRWTYEISDGVARRAAPGRVHSWVKHGGREYLTAFGGGVFVRGAKGWERDGRVPVHASQAVSVGEYLYVGTDAGVYRLRGGFWKKILRHSRGAPRHHSLHLVGGKAYAATGEDLPDGNGSVGLLFEIDGDRATRLLEERGSVSHAAEGPDGRLVVETHRPGEPAALLTRDEMTWRTASMPREPGSRLKRVDGVTFLHSVSNGARRTYEAVGGAWAERSPVSRIMALAEHEGERFLVADDGLYRVEGTGWVRHIAGWTFESAASSDGRLYVADREDGVLIADSGLRHPRPRWRDELLASMAEDNEGAAAAAPEPRPAGPADDGTDDSGRSLFSGLRRRR